MSNKNRPVVAATSARPPLAPLKINPIRSRLSKNEAAEMNNYGEIWPINTNKLGNIPVGNVPSYSSEQIEQKKRNNRLDWARKPRSYGGRSRRAKKHSRKTRRNNGRKNN